MTLQVPAPLVRAALPLFALALAACGDSGTETGGSGSATQVTTATVTMGSTASGSTGSGTGTASETGDTTSGGGVSDSATTSTSDATTSTLPKLDVGAKDDIPDETTGNGEKGCRKVDFLFVIDNSGSMSDEQQSLIASFPGFISAIKDTLKDAQDYHIMVIDSDAWVFGGCDAICPLFFNTCPPAGLGYTCGTPPLECEDILGAGVTYPRGQSSSNKDCNFQSGFRYMDISEPDLAGTFACAAKVGTGSTVDPEKPMEAMVAAVAPQGAAHDCNDGFIRDDAILVVTFITDENDNQGDGSNGTPEGWKAALVSAKKGDDIGIVVLGLFGDNDQPNPICQDLNESNGAEASPRLNQFVDLFGPKGIKGSVCADNYDAFFQQAVSLIDTTCDDFVPPQ
ncbi:MAG: hypothetical protein R3B09_16750 [Nannocystaceae bacterium]